MKKSQFVQQANSICKEAAGERDKGMKAADSQSASRLVTEFAVPPIQKMIDELRDLGPPTGDEEKVEAVIEAFEKGINTLAADPANFSADVAAFDRANNLAEDYELSDCTI